MRTWIRSVARCVDLEQLENTLAERLGPSRPPSAADFPSMLGESTGAAERHLVATLEVELAKKCPAASTQEVIVNTANKIHHRLAGLSAVVQGTVAPPKEVRIFCGWAFQGRNHAQWTSVATLPKVHKAICKQYSSDRLRDAQTTISPKKRERHPIHSYSPPRRAEGGSDHSCPC